MIYAGKIAGDFRRARVIHLEKNRAISGEVGGNELRKCTGSKSKNHTLLSSKGCVALNFREGKEAMHQNYPPRVASGPRRV